MGAIQFAEKRFALSSQEAFNDAYKEAISEYGTDEYNGTISTTEFVGVSHRLGGNFSKRKEDEANDIVGQEDYGRKWECRAIDMGVVCYRITTVKKVNEKATAKFKQMYVVVSSLHNKSFSTKAEADAYAMKLALKDDTVAVFKRPVKVEGNEKVTSFEVLVRETKSEPKKIPKGAVVEEVHAYLLYGLAAY